MKRVKGSRGWIAAAFTILFTIGTIAVRTKAAIQPSGEAPSTLTPPVLSDDNGGVACPSDVLMWTSVRCGRALQVPPHTSSGAGSCGQRSRRRLARYTAEPR